MNCEIMKVGRQFIALSLVAAALSVLPANARPQSQDLDVPEGPCARTVRTNF
jgi:hypothetical protein